MKIIGIIPARMAASRFPGKPLYPICGRPMVEHVVCRARMFPRWDGLYLATCDREIEEVGLRHGWPTIMTSSSHTRCLDRVAEAAEKCGQTLAEDDFVICVQGDEPMLHPDMIAACLRPLEEDSSVKGTVLAMEIIDDEQFKNPDIVKIIYNLKGNVLYTSRSPVPFFNKVRGKGDYVSRRIYGIFGFRWNFLKTFTGLPESPLEQAESCDSNRFLDNGFFQRIAPYPFRLSFSVDSPQDIQQVEDHIMKDPLWGKY
jgi:3-deoxy-manno-octulosonate cytidylyltransferase (CMP-KDO synthetase)